MNSRRLVLVLALIVWPPTACRNVGDHVGQSSAHEVAAKSGTVGPAPSTGPTSLERRAEVLCRARPRCDVVRRRPIAGPSNAEVVDVRLAHAPGATEDEGHCDRREYWLLQSSGEVLLATDCETQWGADNPGPAEVNLQGARLIVKYVEFKSSDGCEMYEASLNLSPAIEIERQVRWEGTARKDRCEPKEQQEISPAGRGVGSSGHPLLVLHR